MLFNSFSKPDVYFFICERGPHFHIFFPGNLNDSLQLVFNQKGITLIGDMLLGTSLKITCNFCWSYESNTFSKGLASKCTEYPFGDSPRYPSTLSHFEHLFIYLQSEHLYACIQKMSQSLLLGRCLPYYFSILVFFWFYPAMFIDPYVQILHLGSRGQQLA